MQGELNTSQFKLIAIQKGEGCGYMVGCGVVVKNLKASTREQALDEARRMLGSDEEVIDECLYMMPSGCDREREIDQAFLVTSCEPLPFAVWDREAQRARHEDNKCAKHDAERAEYDRLKRKFE